MSEKRIEWIDIAKGIGIILVVAGHTSFVPKAIINLIFTFHMPLFFFLSGCVYEKKPDYYSQQVKKLLLKYVVVSCIFSFTYSLISGVGYTNYIQALLTSEWKENDPAIPLWFLGSLFIVKCLFHKVNNRRNKQIIICSFIMLGFLLSHFSFPIRILSSALVGLLFYWIGFLEKQYNWIGRYSKTQLLLIGTVCFGGTVIISTINGRVDMNQGAYHNIPLFILGSISGIIAIVSVSITLLNKSKFLSILGRNSISIYLLHMYTVVMIQCLESKIGIDLDLTTKILNKLASFLIMGFVIWMNERTKSKEKQT